MCFSQEMSLVFAAFGLVMALFAWFKVRNGALAFGILFFTFMETLQGVQFYWINDCANPWNKFLTVVGYAHISLQPYATHTLASGTVTDEVVKTRYTVIKRLSLIAGAAMFLRWVFADWRVDGLCTYMGNYHLAWSVPLMDATYFSPSVFIHCFMMFAPFLINVDRDKAFLPQGLFLFLTGPVLATYITSNLQEVASIWCFSSIGQIFCIAVPVVWRMVMSSPPASAAAVRKAGKLKRN